jgi:hypothetical protein
MLCTHVGGAYFFSKEHVSIVGENYLCKSKYCHLTPKRGRLKGHFISLRFCVLDINTCDSSNTVMKYFRFYILSIHHIDQKEKRANPVFKQKIQSGKPDYPAPDKGRIIRPPGIFQRRFAPTRRGSLYRGGLFVGFLPRIFPAGKIPKTGLSAPHLGRIIRPPDSCKRLVFGGGYKYPLLLLPCQLDHSQIQSYS